MNHFDAHSHIQMREFDSDREAVLRRMEEGGVGAIVVGVDLESSKKAVALAEKYDFLWATVGLHPHDNLTEVFSARGGSASGGNDRLMEAYRALARHPKVVAIGECGLDYSRITTHEARSTMQEEQKEKFKKQIELALELGKPLMLHVRDAYEDTLDILNSLPAVASPQAMQAGKFQIPNSKPRGNVHFFAGTPDIAARFFALGFTISFTGVITFASQYDEVIRHAPLERLLVETDCPFVAPVPHRGKRNEPVYVKEVVKRIAEIRGENEEKIVSALMLNARRAFGL